MSSLYDLQTGLVSLYNGDSAVEAITGRTSQNLIQRRALTTKKLPVVTYHVIVERELGGSQNRRRAIVQIEAWGDPEQGHTLNDLSALIDRAEALFTSVNLAGESPSVDTAVFLGQRRDVFPEPDGVFGVARDFTFEFSL